MGLQNDILELIKKIDGISYNEIITKLKEANKRFEDKSIYVFLKRLKDDGLITSNFGFINGKKHYTYKTTLQAHIPKKERKENPLYRTIVRKMIKPFIEKEINLDTTTKEEDELLEKEIKEVIKEIAD